MTDESQTTNAEEQFVTNEYLSSWAKIMSWHLEWWENGRKKGKPLFDTYAYLLGWSLDLLRAINQLPAWRKWLVRIALGRFAYRELVGLRDALDKNGWRTDFDYGLENMDYHKDKVSL